MAEQHLDDPDVGAELELVRREAVPQDVRRDALVELAELCCFTERLSDRLVEMVVPGSRPWNSPDLAANQALVGVQIASLGYKVDWEPR